MVNTFLKYTQYKVYYQEKYQKIKTIKLLTTLTLTLDST